MRLLFIGDVVGSPGRRGLAAAMPRAARELTTPIWSIVNGENSAGGLGITEKTAERALRRRRRRDHHRQPRLPPPRGLRLPRPRASGWSARPTTRTATPAAGTRSSRRPAGRLAVVNLSGAVQLKVARSPFHEVDAILERLDGQADVIVVDFHAEVTSEKVAMGWHLDGRVAAVFGTHTHVPDRRRPRPARRDRLHQRRRHDRLAGGRDRRQARPGPRVVHHTDAGSLRDRRRGCLGDGGAVEVRQDGLAESIEQILVPAPA